jgi:WD40 repeat protein
VFGGAVAAVAIAPDGTCAHSQSVWALAVAHDGSWLASTTRGDGAIRIWNVADGTPLAVLDGHGAMALPALAPDHYYARDRRQSKG